MCVKSMAKHDPHRPDDCRERNIPEYSFDYCFPGDEFGYKLTVLAGKERQSKSTMASVVPTKGTTGKFASDCCLGIVCVECAPNVCLVCV